MHFGGDWLKFVRVWCCDSVDFATEGICP